ncbi:PadR family transcriptional regulator [uncultured Demequina sp.]|uniref:PadR family transcriptional regulator n=1 Tax=uncultured Demequina sp. TaxID=693499 RepID=UPI0025D3FF51|nr:PadR family transcriptional regulator [uncultured Demequina sp.]
MKHNHDMNAWPIDGGGPSRGRRGHGGHGVPGGPGGPGGPGPRSRGHRGGGRGRGRGDVRAAILVLLAEQPRHGYDLIRAIEERTDGAWAPSPGSIYPTLQSLQDEGLVQVEEVDGRRTASLTDAGRTWIEEHAPDEERLFDVERGRGAHREVMGELRTLNEAVTHVIRSVDTPEATARATEILVAARKDLYRLLADA